MQIPTFPILRQGEVYVSLDTQDIKAVRGGEVAARTTVANSGMLNRDLLAMAKAREALKAIPARELLAICQRAGEYFLNDTLPLGHPAIPQSPDAYVKQLASTSGLPHALIRMNLKRLGNVFAEMPTVIKGLTRGLDLEIFDKGYGSQMGVPVSYAVQADCLGVIMPSNSPAVNALWLPAFVMKVPVVIKPGREEPWTPWRVIQALLKAGAPKEAFSFYPTGHDGSGAIIRRAGRVMLFGDDSTVAQYANDPRIEVHGSGRSKILIGEDKIENWRDYLDVLVEAISANSGRSCINTSSIVVPKYAAEIADAVAERLAEITPKAPEDESAKLSGFANPMMAEWIDGAIADGLKESGARDASLPFRGADRRVERDGMHYLLPTIVHCASFENELSNKEFLFPYASVVEVAQADMLAQIGPSLVVTAITEDKRWIDELLDAPNIDRLNIGPVPTNRISWDQPHEGNLFESLYKRRSISMAA
ncbi:MAG: aldehyde dehydrogenase family protein [Verrucomicrobiales bacterium]